MSRGVSDKITYKPYNQGEQWLLPPSLDELVPQNHFVRIVSLEKYFVDGTKIESAANKYTFVWKKAVEKNEKKLDEKLKKAKRQIEKDYLPRKEKYEKANATFNNRNSYSKTDEDATFMRMKEDHCPCGNPVPYRKSVTKKNKSGYLQTYEVYQCENCEGCPLLKIFQL